MERKTVSIRIDPTIWKEAKKYALEKEMSVGKLIETAVLQLLKR
ncbi:MAG: hypothetical protein V1702_03740 [Candidatus Woesearchaeota archaeon]